MWRLPNGFLLLFGFPIPPLCVISRCLPTLFSAEKSSLLILPEITVPLTPVVSSWVIFWGIIPFIPVPGIAVLVSFVTIIVITSSVSVSLAALASVSVVSSESLFFWVLTIPWFYVPDRCCLPVKQAVLASTCRVCPGVAYYALRWHGAVDR